MQYFGVVDDISTFQGLFTEWKSDYSGSYDLKRGKLPFRGVKF